MRSVRTSCRILPATVKIRYAASSPIPLIALIWSTESAHSFSMSVIPAERSAATRMPSRSRLTVSTSMPLSTRAASRSLSARIASCALSRSAGPSAAIFATASS